MVDQIGHRIVFVEHITQIELFGAHSIDFEASASLESVSQASLDFNVGVTGKQRVSLGRWPWNWSRLGRTTTLACSVT